MIDDERLARLRESAAGLLYVRNRLAGELAALVERRRAPVIEVERAERELREAQHDADEAVAALIEAHDARRARERERLRARALELSITAAAARELE